MKHKQGLKQEHNGNHENSGVEDHTVTCRRWSNVMRVNQFEEKPSEISDIALKTVLISLIPGRKTSQRHVPVFLKLIIMRCSMELNVSLVQILMTFSYHNAETVGR